MNANTRQHRAVRERGLLPDFSAEVLAGNKIKLLAAIADVDALVKFKNAGEARHWG